MSDDISKPFHTDEDRTVYEREYERIFGNKSKKAKTVTMTALEADVYRKVCFKITELLGDMDMKSKLGLLTLKSNLEKELEDSGYNC